MGCDWNVFDCGFLVCDWFATFNFVFVADTASTLVWMCDVSVVMSSDKQQHQSSPSTRHLHSSPSSSDMDLLSSAGAGGAALQCCGATITRSQSSHVLSTVAVEQRATLDSDDISTSLSVLFEDNSLWSNSFAVLYEFYRSGAFCDVDIHIGSRSISCHRLVLACFSQYFRWQFVMVQ